MAKRLYKVTLKDGQVNDNFLKFYTNITRLNGEAPDYAGIQSVAIVSHHMDPDTVHNLCTKGFNQRSWRDVPVTEITRESLNEDDIAFSHLVENYFLPYDEYPNIQ